jgi:hypothetical protein
MAGNLTCYKKGRLLRAGQYINLVQLAELLY